MAAKVLINAGVYVGGADITRAMNLATVTGDKLLADLTAFGATGREFKSGVLSAVAAVSGFYDDTADAALQAEFDTTSNHILTILTERAVGEVGYIMNVLENTLSRGGRVDAPSSLSYGAQSFASPPAVRSKCIYLNTLSATANGTAVQRGAVASGKTLYASLHVISVGGTTPTLDAVVQSDNASNFPSPADKITFSQMTAKGSQWGSVDGPITDDWWRLKLTLGGTTPSFGVVSAIGVFPG